MGAPGIRAVLGAFAVAAIAGCAPKFDVPPAARLSCAASSECPSGLICHGGRCVDAARADTVPPDLASAPTVEPPLGRAGTAFSIELTSSEDLAEPPTLVLGLDAPVEVRCSPSSSARKFLCAYTATGAENGGLSGAVTFDVRLVDLALNESVKHLAGTLRLDFEAPEVLPGSASVTLVVPAGSPLSTVRAATTGTTIHVAFTVDEALAADPVVVASGAGTALALAKLGEAGQSYIYDAALIDTHPAQGSYAVSVTLTDVAGNVATRSLALPGDGLVVDTVPPPAPLTSIANAVVYRRVPWGSATTGGATLFEVTGAPGAVEPSAVVQAFDGPDPATAAQLGHGTAAADGSFGPIALGRADHAVVHVAAVDGAGNRSALADVRDVRWVASLGRKVPGSLAENPTTLASTPALAPVAEQDASFLTEVDERSLRKLLAPDGESVTQVAEQRWRERTFASAAPPDRTRHAMAYDSDRGKVVVCGGKSYRSGYLTDVWEWDGATGLWSVRIPFGLSPRVAAQEWRFVAMAYDQRRARFLLFVGDDGIGATATWEWDPATGNWADRSPPAASSPPVGFDFALAYDARRGKVVLAGGGTWEWDGDAGTWTRRLPEDDPAAPAALGAAMAYDSTRAKVVLWGGYRNSGEAVTWEWDGDAGTWSRTSVVGPPSLGRAALAYDADRGRLILWGGDSSDGTIERPTLWEWDPSGVASWIDRSPAGATPAGVTGAGLVHDVARQRTVLFGGFSHATTSTAELWEWVGGAAGAPGTWVNRTAPSTGTRVPGARQGHAMAYDPLRRKVVLFGGELTNRADTWELDLATGSWAQFVVSPSPGPRTQSAMAYDAARRSMILFGGAAIDLVAGVGLADAETWEWNGSAWSKRSPATSPSARFAHAMTSTVRGGAPRVLLFGGSPNNRAALVGTTWEWDGTANGGAGNWIDVSPAVGPSPRSLPGLAWDSHRQLAVLYGGAEGPGQNGPARGDLWTWDGSAWSSVTVPAAPPLRRSGNGCLYDSARRKLVIWGGVDAADQYSTLSDTWEWDAAAGWIERTPTVPSPPRMGIGAFPDPEHGTLTMFGGAKVGTAMSADAWEWRSGAADRPAFVWRVPWGAAGERRAALLAVEVTAAAVGAGNDTAYPAGAVSGADLLGWDHLAGRWTTLAWNAATSPAAMTYSTADPPTILRLVGGSAVPILIAVAPRGVNGQGTTLSRVTLDHLELAITYRRTP